MAHAMDAGIQREIRALPGNMVRNSVAGDLHRGLENGSKTQNYPLHDY